MVSKFKNFIKDIIFNLLIIFFIITSGNYIAMEIVNNNFFVQHINEIKSHDNIFDEIVMLSKKDSILLVKKYLEAVVDSFIEFEQLPSFDDLKYFFKLIIYGLENNIIITNIEIRNNLIVLICESEKINNVEQFIIQIKTMKYIDDIFYNNYLTINNRYKVKIYCVHNNDNKS